MDDLLPAPHLTADLNNLAGAGQRSVVLDAMEALDDLWTGRADAHHETTTGNEIETGSCHRGEAGRTRVNLENARRQLDRRGLCSQVSQLTDGVKRVCLRDKRDIETRTFEVRDLGQAPPPPDEPCRVTVARPRRQEAAASEVNLLGRRVDEALAELDLAIDRAVLAGLDEIRVVHGFGTGRLRQGIHEWLRTHRQVKRFRLGGEKDPGGAGATIVTLA